MDEQLGYNDISTGIVHYTTDCFNKRIIGYYDIRGYRIDNPKKGLMIIHYQDGTKKKFLLNK